MTRTLKATLAVATMFFALMLPGTAFAQVSCWVPEGQVEVYNGPRTCQCVGGVWKWVPPYGSGDCPWTESGKTGITPLKDQERVEPPPPTPIPEATTWQEAPPAPLPQVWPTLESFQITSPQQRIGEEVIATLVAFLVVIGLGAVIVIGFWKTITRKYE